MRTIIAKRHQLRRLPATGRLQLRMLERCVAAVRRRRHTSTLVHCRRAAHSAQRDRGQIFGGSISTGFNVVRPAKPAGRPFGELLRRLPYVHAVHNRAMRATGAIMPSLCYDQMMPDVDVLHAWPHRTQPLD